MEGTRASEALAGRRLFMPRKALVPARAALRFAQKAAGECGPAQPGRRGIWALAAAGGRMTCARNLRALMLVTQLHN